MDRILVIEKRRGLIKRLVITPEQRYVFKAELDRAIRACMGLKPAPSFASLTVLDQTTASTNQGAGAEAKSGMQAPRPVPDSAAPNTL